MDTKNALGQIGFAVVALVMLAAAGAWGGSGISAEVTNIEFSVGPAQNGTPGTVPFGLGGTAVDAEQNGPWATGGGADSADDDVYRAVISTPLLHTNIMIVDDGHPTVVGLGVGIGAVPGTVPPPQATISTDTNNINALSVMGAEALDESEATRTALLGGALFLQFAVDNAATGLASSAVALESKGPEHPGDVYEAVPATSPATGTNLLVADEDALGLAAALPTNDDTDALIVQQSIYDTDPTIDTDGDSAPDTSPFFFSVDTAFGTPTLNPSDILIPGTGGSGIPAAQPAVAHAAAALGLVATDDVDALYVDSSGTRLLFSLAAGSPTLLTIGSFVTGVGADPGDVIYVDVNVALGPANPIVVLVASEIGLNGDMTAGAHPGDDELNALWVTGSTTAGVMVPVGLSTFAAE